MHNVALLDEKDTAENLLLLNLTMPKTKSDAIVVAHPKQYISKPHEHASYKKFIKVKKQLSKKTFPLDGVSVKAVALMLRAILKHFKYGMNDYEKQQFVDLIAHQSHCPNGAAAGIAEVLKSKI